jgi:hypothetical protein
MFSCHPFRAAAHALVTSCGPEALVGTIRPWSVFKRSELVEGLTNAVIAALIFLLNFGCGWRIRAAAGVSGASSVADP